jgi:Dullard-like phosphatase family protein
LCSNSKILSLSTKNSDKNKTIEKKEEDIFKIECKCEETLKEGKEAILDVIHSQKKQKIYREDKESNSIKIQTDIGANRLVKTKFNEIKSKKQIEDDLGSLTNSQEIRDFHEYTEESIKRMKNIIQNNDLNAYKYVELDDKYIDLIKSGKKKLAVFDLDETLMHREYENYQNCDSVIKVQLPNSGNVEIGIYLRPHLFECIKEINKYYVLTIFTASQQIYADKVLDLIDPNNEFFVKRLYRDSCRKAILEGETIFIKDIQIFKNVPQQKIVIIDNSVLSFCNQIENGIPILPFYSNRDDTELLDLILYLNHLYNANDIRVENKKIIGLQKYYQSNNENSCSSFTEEEENVDNVNENKVLFSKADNLYNDLSDSKYLISSSDLSDFSDCLDISKINLTDSDRKFDKKSSNKELFLYLEIFQKKYDLLCKKQSSN